ncbi:MAG: hypothetical protein U5K29_07590 [Acidimicrobiales bacterium]|nr:hypothetical protein [Acidimicrobiales bacterium]
MGLFKRAKEKVDSADVHDEAVIDLTAEKAPKVEWGFPTRCPDCGDYGYLDRIDVVHEVMYQHCPTCWAKWETSRSETIDA